MLLNKSDLLEPEKLQHLIDIVTSLNPLATVRTLIGHATRIFAQNVNSNTHRNA